VHEKGSSKTKANDLLTILGANNLEDWNEEGRQNRTVKGVFEHSKWDASNLRYSNDIAVLLLNDEVSFTTHIQPICLLTDEREIKTGKVVGWGAVDDYGNTADVAKIAELETISFIHCILNFTRLSFIAWDASFCALSKVDGVCKGDSGSGFYVEIEGRYYLKGIVSSRATKQLNSCVDNQVALYSDISKYIKFIKVKKFLKFITNKENVDKKLYFTIRITF
jgi:secreted trypsin-like serine protease